MHIDPLQKPAVYNWVLLPWTWRSRRAAAAGELAACVAGALLFRAWAYYSRLSSVGVCVRMDVCMYISSSAGACAHMCIYIYI